MAEYGKVAGCQINIGKATGWQMRVGKPAEQGRSSSRDWGSPPPCLPE